MIPSLGTFLDPCRYWNDTGDRSRHYRSALDANRSPCIRRGLLLPQNDRAVVDRSRNGPPRSAIEISLERARGGSLEALGSLLEGCRKYLLVSANRALDSDLRPRTAASDLVQDAFVEVQRDFAKFSGHTEGELLAWLTAILANRLANNVRRHRHTAKRSVNREMPIELTARDALLQACAIPSPCDDVIANDEQRRVQIGIERLSEQDRAVLRLRTWERRSFAEIGEQLNLSAESARKLWGRAVKRLKRELRSIP
jgi:RNA polymerase sigma-70 factor, ECF subfamily